AAEVEPGDDRGRATTTSDASAGPAPETTAEQAEQRVEPPQPIERRHPFERPRWPERSEPPEPSGPAGQQAPLSGFEFGSEPAHGSRRWLLMAIVALLASTLVLALVDLRPGVDPGESPTRCAPEALQREL